MKIDQNIYNLLFLAMLCMLHTSKGITISKFGYGVEFWVIELISCIFFAFVYLRFTVLKKTSKCVTIKKSNSDKDEIHN
tara:strand:+ start:346 stop:582 length:237 start_codon:yes stop_codon:yes gene_type:complete